MFSNRFYTAVARIFPIFTFCGASTYRWCSTTRLFVKSEKEQIIVWYNICFLYFWIGFHFYRLVLFILVGDSNSFIITLAFLLSLFVVAISFTIVLAYDDSSFGLLNSAIIFLRYLTREFSEKQHPLHN